MLNTPSTPNPARKASPEADSVSDPIRLDCTPALGGGAYINPENRDIAEKSGLTVWLKASFDNVAGRVKIDGTRPKFVDKAQAEQLYREREPFYALAKVHVATDDATPDSTADEIIGVLRRV